MPRASYLNEVVPADLSERFYPCPDLVNTQHNQTDWNIYNVQCNMSWNTTHTLKVHTPVQGNSREMLDLSVECHARSDLARLQTSEDGQYNLVI